MVQPYLPIFRIKTGFSTLDNLPSDLRDLIVSFLPLTEQISMKLNGCQIGIHSVHAVHVILGAFGYPQENIPLLLDDRAQYQNILPKNEMHYIWFHDSTNTNRLINDHKLQSVVLVGTMRGTLQKPPILNCPTLQSVTYILPWVTSISGSHWMAMCPFLTRINFIGLLQLQTVGSHWLYHCENLVIVNFNGMNCLETVGDHWMQHCEQLTTLDFTCLRQLRTVGRNWLKECNMLMTPDFDGLYSLQTVNNHWMSLCNRLKTPKFGQLANIKHIGSHWMGECSSLINPQFEGLQSTTLGKRRLKQIERYRALKVTDN